MKIKSFLSLILSVIMLLLFSSCDENISINKNNSSIVTSSENQITSPKAELNSDHKLFLDISINTTENDLKALAENYGYHISLTKYNAGNSKNSKEQNYVYELYDASQFKNETEERHRVNRKYYDIRVTYFHTNNDNDISAIVSCEYANGSSPLVKQIFDYSSKTTQYLYYKQVTTAPAYKEKNWHTAKSSQEAIAEYLNNNP